jgi:mannosyl-oligosaccharide glucosidase
MKSQILICTMIFLTLFTLFINCQWDLTDYGVIIDPSHRSKYFWGTYKPNLYFAMKNRRNVSDVFGIMWYGSSSNDFAEQGDVSQRMRHNCVNDDKIAYHWEKHNGADYGNQIIEDKPNKIKLNTKFVKKDYNATNQQSWDAYIKGEFDHDAHDKGRKKFSLLLYFAMEEFDVKDKSYFAFQENSSATSLSQKKVLVFDAKEQDKDKYNYRVILGENTKLVDYSFQKYRKKYTETWRVKRFVTDDLIEAESQNLSKNQTSWEYEKLKIKKKFNQPNIVVVQLIFDRDFEILINFSSTLKFSDIPLEELQINPFDEMTSLQELKEKEFDKKFEEVYWKEYLEKNNQIKNVDSKLLRKMSEQALSNLLGGIGFFHGTININLGDLKLGETYHFGFRYAVQPHVLFTGTPSRSVFARGFLWDEGFHNIIFSQWDINLSIDIYNSWFSTMSATGWMAREQIRGAEAESQVPEEFIEQDKLVANPPTFIFPINNILEYYKFYSEEKNLEYIKNFLKKSYDKIGASYEWFETYQKSSEGNFQWNGRTSDHNLASGLDDYPRALTPNIYEKHLDLYIWLIEMTKTIRNMCEIFQYESVSHFDKKYNKMIEIMGEHFLDKSTGLMTDYLGPQFKLVATKKHNRAVPPYMWRGDGRCGAEVANPLGSIAECNPYSNDPCCSQFGWCGNSHDHCNCPQCVKSKKLEDRKEFKEKKEIFSPHIGYVNLYPLAFGILKIEDPAFKMILHYLKTEDELFSDYGIRSLSKSDLLYHTGEDYWRGNIWININYMVLRGLYKFYLDDQEAKTIYTTLRENLVKNVFTQWRKEHTFFEQYSDINGKGLKSRNFNGWTSLILNIITERYDS